jgi:hypothetical protein
MRRRRSFSMLVLLAALLVASARDEQCEEGANHNTFPNCDACADTTTADHQAISPTHLDGPSAPTRAQTDSVQLGWPSACAQRR